MLSLPHKTRQDTFLPLLTLQQSVGSTIYHVNLSQKKNNERKALQWISQLNNVKAKWISNKNSGIIT